MRSKKSSSIPCLCASLLLLSGCLGADETVPGPAAIEVSEGEDSGTAANGCQSASDCDDGNPCTVGTCTLATGACESVPTAAECDDGSVCTKGDHCDAGQCVGGLSACSDGNPCTDDGCDPSGVGCSHWANAKACSDADACTKDDVCVDKGCSGQPIACDDGNPCTNDGCDPLKGCTNTLNALPCDDGDACTGGDVCAGGACAGQTKDPAISCSDGNPCTDDLCAPDKGCSNPQKAGTCSDGNPCTEGDKCIAGECVGGDNGCGCTTHVECEAQDDGDLCNGLLLCDMATGKCQPDPTSKVSCADPEDGCGVATCDPKTGSCQVTAVVDGKACDDDNLCTVGDACEAGTCAAGKAADCDDGNVCTADSCKAKVGCLHPGTGAPCDADNNPCTVGDACSAKSCTPGPLKTCSDGNPCTQDACDTKTGKCVNAAAPNEGDPCDADLSGCTVGDTCKAGVCSKGVALPCDDKNACTSDTCHPLEGCKHSVNAKPCEDGNGCTLVDACADGKCKPGNLKSCIDGDKCTLDKCDPQTGECVFEAIGGCSSKCVKVGDCDDANPCTADLCEDGLCVGKPNAAACDDGDICSTVDACQGGNCIGKATKNCSDGNDCTVDSCEPKGGCAHVQASGGCDADANGCTLDICAGGKCGQGANKSCDDNSPCTTDSCDAKTGDCVHDGQGHDGAACDADGSVCSKADACAGGKCVKGALLDCDDGNPCTADACDPVKGCQQAKQSGACDDGDLCTGSGVCLDGACGPGPAKSCTDGDVCTIDTCDAKDGQCKHASVAGCGGFCVVNADCSDGDPCTIDACEQKKCSHVVHDKACADGDKCLATGDCVAGKCVGGSKVDCGDGNGCTDDVCHSATGNCVFTSNASPCDDGNKCTVGDLCKLAKCSSGKATECDDSNGCTDDSCNPKTGGCQHDNNSKPCDDGDACTFGEFCQGGKCQPGPAGELAASFGSGSDGFQDGASKEAKFNYPRGMSWGADGYLYIADLINSRIRRMTAEGQVSTWAGSGAQGMDDGAGKSATFHYPGAVVWAPDGFLYVADTYNHAIRRIDSQGNVTTYTGNGQPGMVNGLAFKARFNLPVGLAADTAAVYVAEHGNHAIRMVTLDGVVMTLAGTGKAGFQDGEGAQAMFSGPSGIAVGKNGSIWVSDTKNHRIRRISSTGFVATMAGSSFGFAEGLGPAVKFYHPTGVAFAADGDLLIVDRQNHRLRRMTPSGQVNTALGDGATDALNEPWDVLVDGSGKAWISSQKHQQVRRFDLPVVLCTDGNLCTSDACDKATGKCVFSGLPDGTKCTGGCLENQVCKGGGCQYGNPKNCNDYDSCTNDYCSLGYCKHVSLPGCK